MRGARSFGNLPLSWKLLLPSIGLIVVLGIAGGFLIVRDLSGRAQAQLDLELTRHSLEAQATFRDRQLSLVEAVNFASNLTGMADEVHRGGNDAVARLLQSVAALKTEIDVLAIVDANGRALAEFARPGPGERPVLVPARTWQELFVRESANRLNGEKVAGLIVDGKRPGLAIAAPICSGTAQCDPVGAAVAVIDAGRIAEEAVRRIPAAVGPVGLTLFDETGRALVSVGSLAPLRPGNTATSFDERIGSTRVATSSAFLEAGSRRLATIAVAIPVERTEAAVRRTGLGLGMILLAVMAGITLIGGMISRMTLRRVRSLVETNRALGRGDLSARAKVRSNDEIGELATHMNEMAEQLQAMYETLESRVAERTEEVERLLRERTEFFASVSHELRTPLAVILRYAEMLMDSAYRGGASWRADAGKALRDSGSQLSELIDDILELAEVEAGRLELETEAVDAGAFLHEMRATIVPLARAARVEARFPAPPKDLPAVEADPRRLRQILLNLADNAIKYTAEGGRIELSTRASGAFVEIAVSDTGVGIPEGTGDRIFEPFIRVKGTQPQQGQASSGLGLAVARRLVEAHRGTIGYESAAGSGTTFVVALPVFVRQRQEAEADA